MSTKRIIIQNPSASTDVINDAIAKASSEAIIKKGRLVIITMKRDSDAFKKVFPNKDFDAFKNEMAKKGISVKWETVSTFVFGHNNDVFVVIFPRQEHLDKIDDESHDATIYAIEFNPNDFIEWKRRWGFVNTNNILSQELMNGLTILAKSINRLTGFSHPSDNKMAKTYVRVIQKYEPDANLEEIRTYLITQHKLITKDAYEFTNWISKIREGSYIKGGEQTGLKKIYTIWQNYKG
jgi:hypothetical protein